MSAARRHEHLPRSDPSTRRKLILWRALVDIESTTDIPRVSPQG